MHAAKSSTMPRKRSFCVEVALKAVDPDRAASLRHEVTDGTRFVSPLTRALVYAPSSSTWGPNALDQCHSLRVHFAPCGSRSIRRCSSEPALATAFAMEV